MSQYKYLLFDADETLFDFKKTEAMGLAHTFEEFGVEPTAEIIDEYHRYNQSLWRALERGEITKAELKKDRFKHIIDMFNFENADPVIMGERYVYHLGQGCYLLDGATEVVKELSKRYSLSIVTNGVAYVQHTRFDASGLQPYFDGLFISDEMGVQKPDKRFFDMVLDKLGADKSECLVIGDSLSSDMKGAHNAGMHKCWYNRTGHPADVDFDMEYEIQNIEELLQIL